MRIEKQNNGNIEVHISYVLMSYLALFGTFTCIFGILYFIYIENQAIFSYPIIGLVVPAVILGISGIVLFEKSSFIFDASKARSYGNDANA